MTDRPLKKVLVVDDNTEGLEDFKEELNDSPVFCFEVKYAESSEAFLKQTSEKPDIFIIDLAIDEHEEPENQLGNLIIEALVVDFPDTPIIVHSWHFDPPDIVEAMRRGATDFVPKTQISYKAVRERIEQHFQRKQRHEEEKKRFEEYMSRESKPLPNERFVVFFAGTPLASGKTSYEALYRYREFRLQAGKALSALPTADEDRSSGNGDLPNRPIVLVRCEEDLTEPIRQSDTPAQPLM